ncbi:MAG TPA: sensor domain-containing protein [Micromonosporaceae bacterium]|nr:sensor domain-containing protein [Micromonosporaceae bacterium]
MTTPRISRHLISVVRGLALTALAVAEALAFLLHMAAFVPGFGLGLVFLLPGPIVATRRVPNLARRLAGAWGGVDIPEPYRPAPPPPVPGPDGLYVRDRQLYKTPRVPAFMARLDWVLGDRATWRDLRWLLIDPVVGGVLAGAPAALVAAGIWYAVTGVHANWWAVPLGLLVILAGLAVAPALLWVHARWTRLMLRPLVHGPAAERRWRWVGERFIVLVRLLALAVLTLLGFPLAVLMLLVFALAVVLGLIVLFPPVVEQVRLLANLRRRLAGRWSGVEVASPYLPRPAPPDRRPDGLFQVGRHLYKSPRVVAYNQRLIWMRRDPATWRDFGWQLTDPIVGGLLLLLPLGAIGYGIWGLALPRALTLVGLKPDTGADWYGAVAGSAAAAVPVGLALAVLGVLVAPAALRWHGRWTRLLLAPTARSQLALRVQRLTETRADAVEVQAAELRRIERDLHDGAQARLVAMGLTLGAIEHLLDRDPAAARALLAEARESSAKALGELRDLVRGIHPPVLAERGLGDAIRALALDTPLPAEVRVDLPGRLPSPVESAVYFAVSEVLTNAVKHARATWVSVELRHTDELLRITVHDDGQGGADPARGSGLRGLQRRLATFDGTIEVNSPAGGPTTVILEVPCALSSPKTSTS